MPDSRPLPSGLLPGSPVLTLRGEQPVEALAIGEMLVGVSGAVAPYAPLRFRRMTRHDLVVRPEARPLRIRADAIDNGVPMEDLVVAPGQLLLVHEALVPAWRLEDGAGIARVQGPLDVIFVRLALDAQDAVLAAGLAVATDADIRDQGTPQEPCAPAMEETALGVLLAGIRLRAEEMGWVTPDPEPVLAPSAGTARDRILASAARLTPPGPELPEGFSEEP